MKKKIVLMISSIFAAILLVVSIVLVIILRSTTDTPINNDVPKVNVGESIVLVNLKKNIKTRFFVGDNMPDLTTYFDIYEDFNPVEVKHEYITTELNMSQAGAYDVVCSYNYYKESVMIYVEDVYKLTTTEESIEVTVEQKNIDYKQYFHLTKNGNNMDITDEMLSIHVDTSQEGRGTVNCAYMNQSKSIIVFVKPKEEIPDITTPGPDVSVDGVKLVVSKDLTFPVGTNIELSKLCELYDGEKKIENPPFKFSTNLNVFMDGNYIVKTSVLYNFKEYRFDDFIITITALEEIVVKERDIERLKKIIIEDEQNVYNKYYTSADLIIKNDFKVGNVTIDYFYPTDLGIMFYYDSDRNSDIITLSYLLQYYYANSTLINLPKLYVLDINKELSELESAEQTEETLKLKNILSKIKNEDYTSLLETKNPGLTAQDGDLWAQGKFYYKYYEENKIVVEALKEANDTYDLKTYSNYLDGYFTE